MEHNGKEIYVRKRTVVWLFTEGERVSNDRLFRVRAIQPFSSNSPASTTSEHQQTPYRSNHVSIGDICAFKKNDGRFRVGKVLQFAYFKEKAKKAQECKQNTVLIAAAAKDNIGVLCTWYNRKSNNTFTIEMIDATETGNFGENIEEMDTELHEYYCLSKYVCTLPFGCVDVIPYDDTDNGPMTSLIKSCKEDMISLVTAKQLFVTNETIDVIQGIMLEDYENTTTTLNEKKDTIKTTTSNQWVQLERQILTNREKKMIEEEQWLSDIHIAFAQSLIKKQFQHINGLQNTLYQLKKPLTTRDKVIQIIHVNGSHWAVISTVDCKEGTVKYYDSMVTTSLSSKTIQIIANLLRFPSSTFLIKVMNVGKQVGTQDCALFSIAFLTSLAHGEDPTMIRYDQDEMRSHLTLCFERKCMTTFPTIKKRKIIDQELKTETISVYCHCRLPDDGSTMFACDGCDEWFHHGCIECPTKDDPQWFCNDCKWE